MLEVIDAFKMEERRKEKILRNYVNVIIFISLTAQLFHPLSSYLSVHILTEGVHTLTEDA